MSLTKWSETLPDDNGFAGDGDDEIVAAKAGMKERLELDHQFSGELDPLEGDCDGYHKKLTMKAQPSDPTPLTGAGVLYTKLVDDVVELFFKDETTGVVNQLTEQGVLSLNTLANSININNFGFTGKPGVNILRLAKLNTTGSNYSKTYRLYYPAELGVVSSGDLLEAFSDSSPARFQPRFLFPGKYRFKFDVVNVTSGKSIHLYIYYTPLNGTEISIIKIEAIKGNKSLPYPDHFDVTFTIRPFLFMGETLEGLLEEVV